MDTHPTLNKLFNGESSEAKWEELLEFLRLRYGRTHRQQVQSIINGICRDGHTPLHLLSLIDDHLGQVTIDDVKKKLLFQQLPATVCHALGKMDHLTPEEVTVAVDIYFDCDGHKLNTSQTSGLSYMAAAPSDWDFQVHPGAQGPKI